MMVVTRVARNANQAIVAPVVGSSSLRLSRVWSQAVGFVLVRLAGIRCLEDVFTFKTFYKLCTFNAICKDTAAIYYITVQRRKDSFVSSLTGIVA
jgi:hypothetical protein